MCNTDASVRIGFGGASGFSSFFVGGTGLEFSFSDSSDPSDSSSSDSSDSGSVFLVDLSDGGGIVVVFVVVDVVVEDCTSEDWREIEGEENEEEAEEDLEESRRGSGECGGVELEEIGRLGGVVGM